MTPIIDPHFHINQKVPHANLKSFCDVSQDFLRFLRCMAKFTKMDHVQHDETLCQRLAIISDHSLDNITYNACENKKNPKYLILILETGA